MVTNKNLLTRFKYRSTNYEKIKLKFVSFPLILLDGVPFCHRNENCLKKIKKKPHNYRIILGIYKRSIGNHFQNSQVVTASKFRTDYEKKNICNLRRWQPKLYNLCLILLSCL
jgi:hypothetical protein